MILDEIHAYKKTIVSELKKQYSYCELEKLADEKNKTSPKKRTFQQAVAEKGLSLIAEVKKGSPSKGIIRQNFNPMQIAQEFESNGAQAISVLTDEKFFFGSNDYLGEIAHVVSLPLLRKDFIIDPIQILESKIIGADAILLIAALLDELTLENFYQLAKDLKLDVLCEVHDENELETALCTSCDIIGINNRNLKTFDVDVQNTFRLNALIPSNYLVVCESGITHTSQLIQLNQEGIDGVLIGEGLATHPTLYSFWNKTSG